MGLKLCFDAKKVFLILYLFAFFIYFIIGLQPADAIYQRVDSSLEIPKINLVSDVTRLQLENGELITPDSIVGSFSRNPHKTLLIGHSTSVFKELHKLNLRDVFKYKNQVYRISRIDMVLKNDISMSELLSTSERDTVIIMTCAGKDLGAGDSTHRLILTGVSK